jgi:hypothetical protein
MFLFIAQKHQNLFSIFKTRVHREYDNVIFIIDENKNKQIDKSDLQKIHDLLLSEFSNE